MKLGAPFGEYQIGRERKGDFFFSDQTSSESKKEKKKKKKKRGRT